MMDLFPASDAPQDDRHLVLAIGCRQNRDRATDHLLGSVAEGPRGGVALVTVPSRFLLTIASSEDSTIAANQPAARSSEVAVDLDSIGASGGLAH